jgi:hypothetical protein
LQKNGARKRLCQFTEIYENNHTEIRLASGPKYYLAFRPNGKPYTGNDRGTKQRRSCKQFLHKLISQKGKTEDIHPEAEGYQPVNSFNILWSQT